MADEPTVGNGNGLKKATWRSRRKMAFISLAWIILETLLLFFVVPESKILVLKEPISASYYVMGGIVAAYMGFKSFSKDKAE